MKQITLMLFLVPLLLGAQDTKRYDSLRTALKNCTSDTAVANTYNKLARYFLRKGMTDSARANATLELNFSEKIGYARGIAQANSIFGSAASAAADYKASLEYRKKALAIYESMNDSLQMGIVLSGIGSMYQNLSDYDNAKAANKRSLFLLRSQNERLIQGSTLMNMGAVAFYQSDYSEALGHYLDALKIYEEDKNEKQAANVYINIGNVYNYQKTPDKAIEMYRKALEIHERIGGKYGAAACYLNIGELLAKGNKHQDALENFNRTLSISKEISNIEVEALALSNLGSLYVVLKEYDKGLRHLFEALELQNRMGNLQLTAQIKNEIGDVYILQKKFTEARKFIGQSLEAAMQIRAKENIKRSYLSFASLYEATGDYKSALEYQKKYADIKDSIYGEESAKQISEMSAKYQTEKKEKENEILRQKDEINTLESVRKDSEISRQRIAIAAVCAGLLMMIILAFYIFKGYRQKQHDNRIIETQKALVEGKNKDITDSILYAKKIQEALLPAKEIKYRIFPDAFVLFEPRDIVSGDFYWFTEKNGRRLIAAVDCTGHGVPGAFMSLIGNAFLHEVVNEKGITEPSQILGELRDMIIRSLRQTGSEVQSQDGMDIALLCFDGQNTKAAFAGANNPLWVIGQRKNGVELEEYSANKRPIGYYLGQSLPFEGHQVTLRPGDALYIFTDGFADQFGGPHGKKFKYKQLQQLLISIHHETMPRQEAILREAFINWKGGQAQVDDVLVIGIRV